MTKKTTFQNASNFGATFTQLLRNEKPFGHQFAKFDYHLTKFYFIAELFTNVKLRADQIPPFVRGLSDTFRKIINSDVRYRQRQDDLPCAVGCRAFGVQPLGGGWYSPNIKVACNNAQVLEYICRQWCKRTAQYPHYLEINFDKINNAVNAMPKMPDKYSNYWDSSNRHIRREAHCIIEEYHFSMPFRLEHYAVRWGFVGLRFGSACRILPTSLCHFDNLNNLALNLNISPYIINDFFEVQGLRAVQSWGHYNKPKEQKKDIPDIKKVRKFYGGNTDKKASLYYRACKAGYFKFNAYEYGRIKAGCEKYIPIERKNIAFVERLSEEENAIMRQPDFCADPEGLAKWKEERLKKTKCLPKALRIAKK